MKRNFKLVHQRNGNSCGVAGFVVMVLIGGIGVIVAILTLVGAIAWKVSKKLKKKVKEKVKEKLREKDVDEVEFITEGSGSDKDSGTGEVALNYLLGPPGRAQIILLCLLFLGFVTVVAFRMVHH